MVIQLSDLTNGSTVRASGTQPVWEGTAIFDVLMKAVNENINIQYELTRITGSDYATVYLGAIETCIKEATNLLLQKAIADSRNYVTGLSQTIDTMINTKVSKSIEQLTLELIPVEDNDTTLITSRKEEARQTIITLYNDKPDLQNYKGTQFGIVSAVSDYISHAQPKRIGHSTIDNTFIKNIEGSELLEKTRNILNAV